ncbi:hypothetical protein QR680_000039 [Steinernema hermaphroditum]|uniref:peroxidase n=1 Tax=Steinernema hermaphroditum TaxID=289476 RepID=A0AA39GTA5_9BILA|nr:hypothetical protein QR680_000039 [Steinernema hermaphroditum]
MRTTLTVFLLFFGMLFTDGQQRCLGHCCDETPSCFPWAEIGECARNPNWMLPHCPVSCRACPNGTRDPLASPGCPFVQTREAETRPVMSRNEFVQITHRKGCAQLNLPNVCEQNMCYHLKYRSFDGSCNNLNNSLWGAAFMPFLRLLEPNYDDDVNAPIGSMKRHLPNPREITHHLLRSPSTIIVGPNALLMQWGQFLSHDMTMNTLANGCNCSFDDPRKCMNIRGATERRCIAFTRSVPACGTSFGNSPREQVNANTPFIDGSQIYGSDSKSQNAFRLQGLNAGFLRATMNAGRMFPPHPIMTGSFVAGDDRSNLFNGLGAFHTIFLRLHNIIASHLRNINPGWNPDRLFQETRKIVGAYMQVITYKEFLPALLGQDLPRLVPPYMGYNSNLQPMVTNEFAGAAYRLHGLIMESYPMRDSQWRKTGDLMFFSMEGDISRVINAGTDFIIRGLISTASRAPQRITFQLTDRVLNGQGDMGSVNIQRGRDHGFQSYNKYRALCKLPPIRSFDEWPEVHDTATRERVRLLYNNDPENIDLFVGGTVEDPAPGSVVGPTFACIIADQFVRSRDGDRFYFENPGIFTPPQVETLKTGTLASVICLTGENMPAMVPNAFQLDDGSNIVPCETIPSVNLNLWKDPTAGA